LADVPIDEADKIMAHDDNVDAESTHDLKRLSAAATGKETMFHRGRQA
jgi:hypothetical protein